MSNTWQYYMLKALSWVLCLLPYRLLLLIGSLLGRLYYLLAPRQRRRATKQIREHLQLSQSEAEIIIKSFFVKLGQTFLEVMYMPALTPQKMLSYVKMENRHYLEEAMAAKKGVVFLTAHLGNWEWFGAALASAGFPVADIVKAQPNEQHTRILNEYRQMFGIEVFLRGTSEVIGAARAVKKGKLLGFFVDQDAGVDGVFVKFFAKMASTPLGPAVFARKFNAPVVPGFISRCPEGGHRIVFQPPIYFQDSGQPDEDLYSLTVKMTQIVEQAIRTNPDEWLWFQKRWNTPWPGEKNQEIQGTGEINE